MAVRCRLPIRAEYRKHGYYGAAWRAYRAALILAHGNRCSKCGRAVPKYLNVAHLDHNPESTRVRLLCVACHNRHDAGYRLAVMRRRRARLYGQLWLWRELECWPDWLMPRRRPARPELAPTLF